MQRLHFKGSPGDGVTMPHFSREPLATEGEATPGPDDYNPYAELESRQQMEEAQRERKADVQPSMPTFDAEESLDLPPLF